MKKHLSLILLLALAGCSNESEKSKSPASDGFPQDVQSEAVVSMKPLTIEQKNPLKSMLLKIRIIPNSDLILYKAENQDDKSRASRAEQVKKLSPESRAVYDRILAQCQIVQPKEEKSGDQSSNAGAISYTQEASSIYGTQCPLNLQKSSQGSVKVLSSNIDQFKNGTAKVLEIVQESNSESLDKMRVTSDDLQNSSGLVSSDSKESFYFKFKTSAEVNQIYDEFSIKAQAQLTQYGLINVTAVVRGYTKMDKNGKTLVAKSYTKYSMNTANLEVILQWFNNGDDTQIYLNGEKLTKEQLQDFFPGSSL